MKILVTIARIFVGVLFIFSGFIKLNDPLGFQYKLQEYFAPEVLNLEFLSPYALLMAIILVVVEVLLGVALLIGYQKQINIGFLLYFLRPLKKLLEKVGLDKIYTSSTLLLLFVMIVFFTFLTFYSAYFNKVTDCGCFGDAIPLVPWESFIKDVILLVLILFLMITWRKITPIFTKNIRSIIIFASFFGCMIFGYYVLMHLPWLDFRAYKEGANIAENMVVPEGAPEAIFEYDWKFEVNGEEQIITTTGGYPQVEGGTFIDYETRLLQEGYVPPVHDFTIESAERDHTTEFLEMENLVVIVAYNLDKTEREGYYNIRKITEEAIRKGYTVIGLTSSSAEVHEAFAEAYKLPFSFYFTDETVLKTIVRASPGIVSMNKATILQKLHWNDAKDLTLKELPTAKPLLDFELKRTLDSIAVLDQKYRKLMHLPAGPEREALGKKLGLSQEDYGGNLWEKQVAIDTSNLKMVERVLQSKGYPGRSMVGEPTHTAVWYVIQHSNKIGTYLPQMKEAGEKGELPFRLVAMMEDRYLMEQEKPQIYGTQGVTYNDSPDFIWPIKNPETVNERRQKAGFTSTIEQYAQDLFGENFEYKVFTLDQALTMKRNAPIH